MGRRGAKTPPRDKRPVTRSQCARQESALYGGRWMVAATLGPDPSIALPHDRWATLALTWDLDEQGCCVTVDGEQASVLRSRRDATGVCYLRLRADPVPAQAPGYLLDSVVVEVTRSIDAAGRIPMYRCNQDNVASRALCLAVGYTEVAELAAVSLRTD